MSNAHPAFRTIPATRTARALVEAGPSLSDLALMLDAHKAHEAKEAKIQALLADSCKCVRAYMTARQTGAHDLANAIYQRRTRIERELMDLGLDLH